MKSLLGPAATCAALATILAGTAAAQTTRGYTRFSLFAQVSDRTWDGGETSSYSQFIAAIAVHSPRDEGNGFEYALDARTSTLSGEDRSQRISVYNAYAGCARPRARWACGSGRCG